MADRWQGDGHGARRPGAGSGPRLKAGAAGGTAAVGSATVRGRSRPDSRRAQAGRKVRAPQGKVPGNAWAARADGKCHREQTAERRLRACVARVKRCGKSAPRRRQRRRHGKPHLEQDRIGVRWRGPRRTRVGRWSRRASVGLEEWLSGARGDARVAQNPAYRPAPPSSMPRRPKGAGVRVSPRPARAPRGRARRRRPRAPSR